MATLDVCGGPSSASSARRARRRRIWRALLARTSLPAATFLWHRTAPQLTNRVPAMPTTGEVNKNEAVVSNPLHLKIERKYSDKEMQTEKSSFCEESVPLSEVEATVQQLLQATTEKAMAVIDKLKAEINSLRKEAVEKAVPDFPAGATEAGSSSTGTVIDYRPCANNIWEFAQEGDGDKQRFPQASKTAENVSCPATPIAGRATGSLEEALSNGLVNLLEWYPKDFTFVAHQQQGQVVYPITKEQLSRLLPVVNRSGVSLTSYFTKRCPANVSAPT